MKSQIKSRSRWGVLCLSFGFRFQLSLIMAFMTVLHFQVPSASYQALLILLIKRAISAFLWQCLTFMATLNVHGGVNGCRPLFPVLRTMLLSEAVWSMRSALWSLGIYSDRDKSWPIFLGISQWTGQDLVQSLHVFSQWEKLVLSSTYSGHDNWLKLNICIRTNGSKCIHTYYISDLS